MENTLWTNHCYAQMKSVKYLLLGFFAQTIAEGGLRSPAPDSLIAETLNSYSAPSVTSFTA